MLCTGKRWRMPLTLFKICLFSLKLGLHHLYFQVTKRVVYVALNKFWLKLLYLFYSRFAQGHRLRPIVVGSHVPVPCQALLVSWQ